MHVALQKGERKDIINKKLESTIYFSLVGIAQKITLPGQQILRH
jgi:hypothetical protein